MDISEQYIRMCEHAEEIQTSGFTPQSSFLLHPLPEHIKVLTIWQHQYSGQYSRYDLALDQGGHYWLIPPSKEACIWLPRQDQLQILSNLSWQEFDKECLKYDAETKEQAGIQVVIKRLTKKEQWEKNAERQKGVEYGGDNRQHYQEEAQRI